MGMKLLKVDSVFGNVTSAAMVLGPVLRAGPSLCYIYDDGDAMEVASVAIGCTSYYLIGMAGQ